MSAAQGSALREHAATVVVSGLSTLFAVALILTTGVMGAALDPELIEGSGTFRMTLLMVSAIFIIIALYVGAIVTANTFATIIAGRTRTIALYRLIGSTSARIRSRVAGEGLLMGAIGAAIGFVLAEALIAGVVHFGPGWGWLPEGPNYPLFDPLAIVAVAVVTLTTWAAAWAGSRRVGSVSPIAATGASVELRPEESRGRRARTVWAWILIVIGAALLAGGIALSVLTPMALMVSFFGGLFSFTGIAVGAHFIMPPVLKLTGKLIDRGPTGSLAAANAVRFPERSARSTIGLVIGVTLVIMFAVALESYRAMTLAAFDNDPAMAAILNETLTVTTAIFTGLVGFSAIIAAVGMVNTLSLSVLQRTRELGLLRAVGTSRGQVRRMVRYEAVITALIGGVLGVVLGVVFAIVVSRPLADEGFTLSIPVVTLLLMLVLATVAGVIAAIGPARRASRLDVLDALAYE